jgi:hypothetical protein
MTSLEFVAGVRVLLAQYDGTIVVPPVDPPYVPPVIPPATGIPPKGVQWHGEYRMPATSNAARNFNWLMDKYGSSWAFAYMMRSATGISNDVSAALGADGSRIINTFGGQANYAPAGSIIPFGVRLDAGTPGPTLHAFKPAVNIPLPHPDTA